MKSRLLNDNWKFWEVTNSFALNWAPPADAVIVDLPHDAMIEKPQDPDCPSGANTGYRKGGVYSYSRTLYAASPDRTYILKVEGAYMNAFVYVNGQLASKRPFGYTVFYVPLNRFLEYGKENEIRIQVRSGAEPNSRWYSGTGLYRDVYLLEADEQYIKPDSVQISTTELTAGNGISYAKIHVDALIVNRSAEKNGSLDATATQYWQDIRSRAKVSTDLQATISATVISKEAENDWGAYSGGKLLTDPTLYNIRRERRCELMAESLRWMDLQRWRSLDQMMTQGYHIEGFKIWGPMQHWYDNASGESTLISGLDNPKAYVSPKDRSLYFRPYEIVGTSPALNGYKWHLAHYLTPIAIQDMLIASENSDISSSTIYQNPYWPTEADQSAIQ